MNEWTKAAKRRIPPFSAALMPVHANCFFLCGVRFLMLLPFFSTPFSARQNRSTIPVMLCDYKAVTSRRHLSSGWVMRKVMKFVALPGACPTVAVRFVLLNLSARATVAEKVHRRVVVRVSLVDSFVPTYPTSLLVFMCVCQSCQSGHTALLLGGRW